MRCGEEMQQKCTLFPERLANLREKANLTRQQLADILGISRASLEYYEKGKRTPDIDVLYKLSEYFNVTADYLIGRTNKSGQSTDVNAVSEFVGLSPFAVEHLNYYAATYEFCIDFLGDDLYNDKTKKKVKPVSQDLTCVMHMFSVGRHSHIS